MNNKFFKPTIITTILLALSLIIPALANAQLVTPSKGRTNGLLLEFDDHNQRSIKRIRDLVNEGKHESAANRAITFIKNREGGTRDGLDKTPLFYEAYNLLCVSSTGLGKVEYAMEACDRSLILTPGHWESLKSRATLYFLIKDYEKSLADFKLALDNAPDNDAIRAALRQNISVVESK